MSLERKCQRCGGTAKNFKTSYTEREFQLTGFCQLCQDEEFGPWEPDEPFSEEELEDLEVKYLDENDEETEEDEVTSTSSITSVPYSSIMLASISNTCKDWAAFLLTDAQAYREIKQALKGEGK
jgi:hypothetical protein